MMLTPNQYKAMAKMALKRPGRGKGGIPSLSFGGTGAKAAIKFKAAIPKRPSIASSKKTIARQQANLIRKTIAAP